MEVEITIISGRSLYGADVNGRSDPYVYFGQSEGPVNETFPLENTCHPKWNQTFSITIKPHGEIIFHAYDHDKHSSDESLGYGSTIVPYMHEGETWYDVIQLSSKGVLNIKLVCKKGPKKSEVLHPFDKLANQILLFNFHKVINVGNIFGKLMSKKARIRIELPDHNDQYCPRFNYSINGKVDEEFYVKCKPGDKLKIIIEEREGSGYKTLDYGYYKIGDFYENESFDERISTKNHDMGINFNVCCLRSVYHNVYPDVIPPINEYEKGVPFKCNVYIHKAEDIVAGDMNGKSDAYVRFKTSGSKKEKKTHVHLPSLSPSWKRGFTAKVVEGEQIKFRLYDHDTVGSDDLLGSCKYHLQNLNTSSWEKVQLNFDTKGTLKVEVKRAKVVSPGYKKLMSSDAVGVAKSVVLP